MDDELDRLLRTGARPVPTGDDARTLADDAWTQIRRGMAEEAPGPGTRLTEHDDLAARRRRRPVRLASITVAVVLAGAGSAAAADYLATRTGQEATATDPDTAGRGEWLNPAGIDRTEVFDQVTADIEFPPGYEASRQYVLDFFPAESDTRLTEGALRSATARAAVCSWGDAWVAADDAGDAAARDAATAVLVAAPTWPDIAANDIPDTYLEPDGSTRSYNGWVPPARRRGCSNRPAGRPGRGGRQQHLRARDQSRHERRP